MAKSRRQHVEVQDGRGTTRVTLQDPIIDEQNSGHFTDQALAAVEGAAEPHLVLDFGQVLFVSSAGLSALIRLQQKLQARGGTLKVCNLRPEIYQVFEATGLPDILNVEPQPLP